MPDLKGCPNHAPTGQNFLDSMQFLGNFDKIVCWCPLPRRCRCPILQGILDPPLIPSLFHIYTYYIRFGHYLARLTRGSPHTGIVSFPRRTSLCFQDMARMREFFRRKLGNIYGLVIFVHSTFQDHILKINTQKLIHPRNERNNSKEMMENLDQYWNFSKFTELDSNICTRLFTNRV